MVYVINRNDASAVRQEKSTYSVVCVGSVLIHEAILPETPISTVQVNFSHCELTCQCHNSGGPCECAQYKSQKRSQKYTEQPRILSGKVLETVLHM